MGQKIRKILVANRGEIAVRVMRTCRELGISTVAIFSEADRDALHVRTADQAYCVGPPPSRESYLAEDRIIDAAKRSKADAIHPGYGFLSENPSFVRTCEKAGLVFIGPPASAMTAMGEKTRARTQMSQAGVPIVPGTTEPLRTFEAAKASADKIGYPVMLKAAGGGGGKGLRTVDGPQGLESAWRLARSEALSAFGNDAIYLEKLLERPHHIEIQVFADAHGTCIHLNERECSAQRRHQKVIEETPSPIVPPRMRDSMGQVAIKAAKAVGYIGAGTVEFLVDAQRKFYFLEMNTRLQVEHPITEWVTGLDLVAWQIKVAEGMKLPLDRPISPRGHAIEARIYAEDPAQRFLPSPGRIRQLAFPSGHFVRNDTGAYAGYTVSTYYDPLISKLSVWGHSRQDAIARLGRALDEYVVTGITTNIAYLRSVLRHPEFTAGNYDTGLLDREHAALLAADGRAPLPAVIAALVVAHERDRQRVASSQRADGSASPSPWRQLSWRRRSAPERR
ncbi:MAG TPA: acetyl-CoA carboxylase biotin carboxylase subunit [Myxococcaceae bacterium]|nr:acetyl-CoA carboxylase biotin carboxylase subunit [Myxococcaceae bacterium]